MCGNCHIVVINTEMLSIHMYMYVGCMLVDVFYF